MASTTSSFNWKPATSDWFARAQPPPPWASPPPPPSWTSRPPTKTAACTPQSSSNSPETPSSCPTPSPDHTHPHCIRRMAWCLSLGRWLLFLIRRCRWRWWACSRVWSFKGCITRGLAGASHGGARSWNAIILCRSPRGSHDGISRKAIILGCGRKRSIGRGRGFRFAVRGNLIGFAFIIQILCEVYFFIFFIWSFSQFNTNLGPDGYSSLLFSQQIFHLSIQRIGKYY